MRDEICSTLGLERGPVLRAAPAIAVHYDRRQLEQMTLYRLVRDHFKTFLAQVQAGAQRAWPNSSKTTSIFCPDVARRFTSGLREMPKLF